MATLHPKNSHQNPKSASSATTSPRAPTGTSSSIIAPTSILEHSSPLCLQAYFTRLPRSSLQTLVVKAYRKAFLSPADKIAISVLLRVSGVLDTARGHLLELTNTQETSITTAASTTDADNRSAVTRTSISRSHTSLFPLGGRSLLHYAAILRDIPALRQLAKMGSGNAYTRASTSVRTSTDDSSSVSAGKSSSTGICASTSTGDADTGSDSNTGMNTETDTNTRTSTDDGSGKCVASASIDIKDVADIDTRECGAINAVNARDTNGDTALTLLAAEGAVEVVHELLRLRADVNAQDRGGYSALMNAVIHGHSRVVEALLAAGAKVDLCTDSGSTALVLAAARRRRDIVRALVCAGADVNTRDSMGMSALLYAVEQEDEEIMTALLEVGADIDAVVGTSTCATAGGTSSVTALSLAKARGATEAVALLLRAKETKVSGLTHDTNAGISTGEDKAANAAIDANDYIPMCPDTNVREEKNEDIVTHDTRKVEASCAKAEEKEENVTGSPTLVPIPVPESEEQKRSETAGACTEGLVTAPVVVEEEVEVEADVELEYVMIDELETPTAGADISRDADSTNADTGNDVDTNISGDGNTHMSHLSTLWSSALGMVLWKKNEPSAANIAIHSKNMTSDTDTSNFDVNARADSSTNPCIGTTIDGATTGISVEDCIMEDEEQACAIRGKAELVDDAYGEDEEHQKHRDEKTDDTEVEEEEVWVMLSPTVTDHVMDTTASRKADTGPNTSMSIPTSGPVVRGDAARAMKVSRSRKAEAERRAQAHRRAERKRLAAEAREAARAKAVEEAQVAEVARKLERAIRAEEARRAVKARRSQKATRSGGAYLCD